MSERKSRRIGTSFSLRRCASLGLAGRTTFMQVLDLELGLIRISAFWDEIHRDGYAELDWLLDAARDAGQPIVMTVGMKAMRWPEFYIPSELQAVPRRGGRIGVEGPFAQEVIAFVSETVARYRERPEIVAWQVENEPFNRSGPRRWWIDPGLVRREMQSVRGLDSRPVVLNAFAHFDSEVDEESRPRRGLLGALRLRPEKAILALLDSSDILGLDVYTVIGARRAAPDWAQVAASGLRAAQRLGRSAWITEAQAEPWQSSSFAPDDMQAVSASLFQAGFSTVLLWGVEYWFGRAAAGDTSWLEAAKRLVDPRGFEPLTF